MLAVGVAVHLLASGTGATDWLENVFIQNNRITDVRNAALRLDRPDGAGGSGIAELCICGDTIEQEASLLAGGAAMIDLHLAPLTAAVQGAVTVRETVLRLSGTPAGGVHAIRIGGAIGMLAILDNDLDGGDTGRAGDAQQPASSAIYVQTQDQRDGPIPASAVVRIAGNRIGGFENGITLFDPIAGVYGGLNAGAQVIAIANDSIWQRPVRVAQW